MFFEKILENIFWVMKIFCGNFDLYSELFFLVNITITHEIHTAGHIAGSPKSARMQNTQLWTILFGRVPRLSRYNTPLNREISRWD